MELGQLYGKVFIRVLDLIAVTRKVSTPDHVQCNVFWNLHISELFNKNLSLDTERHVQVEPYGNSCTCKALKMRKVRLNIAIDFFVSGRIKGRDKGCHYLVKNELSRFLQE